MDGKFNCISGLKYKGYEIHMGDTVYTKEANVKPGNVIQNGNVYGSYIHGIFDEAEIANAIVKTIADSKGIKMDNLCISLSEFKEREYDKLADIVRESMDMDAIYKILKES